MRINVSSPLAGSRLGGKVVVQDGMEIICALSGRVPGNTGLAELAYAGIRHRMTLSNAVSKKPVAGGVAVA
jgi:hypothetical protein